MRILYIDKQAGLIITQPGSGMRFMPDINSRKI
jgi:hypothetical protein